MSLLKPYNLWKQKNVLGDLIFLRLLRSSYNLSDLKAFTKKPSALSEPERVTYDANLVKKRKRSEMPKGPSWNVPLLGYFPFMTKNPHIHFYELIQKYGRIYSCKFGRNPGVVLNDWDDIKEAFVTRANQFTNRPLVYTYRLGSQGHGIIQAEGSYRKNQKKFLIQAIKKVNDNPNFIAFLNNEIRTLCEAIDALISNPSNRIYRDRKTKEIYREIDLRKLVERCFINVACGLVFGYRYDYTSEEITHFMHEVEKNFELVGQKTQPLNVLPPWLRDTTLVRKLFAYEEFFESLNYMSRFMLKHIARIINEREAGVIRKDRPLCLVDIYLDKMYNDESQFGYAGFAGKSLDFVVPPKPLNILKELTSQGFTQEFITGEELGLKFMEDKDRNLQTPSFSGNAIEKSYKEFLVRGNVQHGFTGADMIASLMEIFLGGTETTAAVMRWALYHMSMRPDIQESVFEEIDKFNTANYVANAKESVLENFTFSYELKDELPYSQAALMEVQRRASVAPIGIFHATLYECPAFKKTYRIPEGAHVVSNIYAVQHDERYWPNPFEIIPERFLKPHTSENNVVDGIKEENSSSPKEVKYQYTEAKPSLMPFSIGLRTCIGQSIAKNELFVGFAHLMWRYKFRLSPNTHVPIRKGKFGEEVEGIMTTIWSPPHFKLLVQHRGKNK